MTVKKALAVLLILLFCTACARQEGPSGTVNDATEEAGSTTNTEADANAAETYSYIENEDTDNRCPRLNFPHLVQLGQYYFGSFSDHTCFMIRYSAVC